MSINKDKESRDNLKSEIQKLKSELSETYGGIVEFTIELEKKNDELLKANQKIKEQQEKLLEEEKLKTILEMAGATAHEIAQPLSVVSERCELVSMINNLDPDVKYHIDSILVNVKKIINIIHKIQSINRDVTKPYDQDFDIIDIYKG